MIPYNRRSDDNDYLAHYGVRGMKWDPDKLKRKGQYAYDSVKGAYNVVKKNAKQAALKAYGKTEYGKADLQQKKYTRMAESAKRQYYKSYNRSGGGIKGLKVAARYGKAYDAWDAKAKAAGEAKRKTSPSYKAKVVAAKGLKTINKTKIAANKAKKDIRTKVTIAGNKALKATGQTAKFYGAKHKAQKNVAAAKKEATRVVNNKIGALKKKAEYIKNTPERKKREKENLKARNRAAQQAQIERNKQNAKYIKQRLQNKKQKNTTQGKRIRG